MITLETSGFEEAVAHIDRWIRLLESTALWAPASSSAAEVLRRYAASISPVITGSYQGAHAVFPRGMGAVMTIDPAARNTRSGAPVTSYAGFVEERHDVYGRTAQEMSRAGVAGVEVLQRRFV